MTATPPSNFTRSDLEQGRTVPHDALASWPLQSLALHALWAMGFVATLGGATLGGPGSAPQRGLSDPVVVLVWIAILLGSIKLWHQERANARRRKLNEILNRRSMARP